MDAKQILINFRGWGAGGVCFGGNVYFRNLALAWLLEGRGVQLECLCKKVFSAPHCFFFLIKHPSGDACYFLRAARFEGQIKKILH